MHRQGNGAQAPRIRRDGEPRMTHKEDVALAP
jgi:hypothetical protein